jgi:hypothetical protein
VRNNADFYLLDNDDPPDRGYEIVYGKNMTGISWSKSTDGVVTRIVPIGEDADGRRMLLPEQWIDSPHIGEYPVIHTGTLTVSDAKEVVVEESDDEDVPASDIEPFTKEECYELMRQAAADEFAKAAFVRVVNKLIGDRATLLADLREIQETYSGTDELSQRLHELDDRLNAEAEAVQGLIAQNARVAQNQDDYNAAYDAAVSRYETTKAEREKVAADIRQRGIRRREFERFISELEKLPEAVSEFDETLWGSLVDYVTVGKDKTMVFTLIGGTEVKA